MKVKVDQLCPTLYDPMYYTVRGISQARILEWVAVSFSRGSSRPRNWTQVSCIAGRIFTVWAPREAHKAWDGSDEQFSIIQSSRWHRFEWLTMSSEDSEVQYRNLESGVLETKCHFCFWQWKMDLNEIYFFEIKSVMWYLLFLIFKKSFIWY